MTESATIRSPAQRVGLVAGPVLFLSMMLLGIDQQVMNDAAWRTAAVGLWMATWWVTEAVPVSVTAFLPLVAFDLLGIMPIRDAAAPYANPIIYLFLGAFILAAAVERWHLHRRIALWILTRTGTEGRRLILGFMLVAALLSMWMTNTSTTMMLLPIAISVVGVISANVPDLDSHRQHRFQIAMMLGLAFAATIGGLSTLVGTPPNALLAGFMSENYGIEIGFMEWMLVGVPISAVMLPLAWLVLTRFVYPVDIPESADARAHLDDMRRELGPMSAAEKRVAAVFLLVVIAWMLRRPLNALGLEGLSDPGIVMAAALLLFVLPSGDRSQAQLMVWHDVRALPWGVLILFGGGLSLAAAVSGSGLAQWLGESLAPLTVFGPVVLIVAATALVIFLTELTSNLATTATFLPVMAAIAVQAGIDPMMLCVPITLAASCAFMLPVATPPNAIVFSSGLLSIPQMARAGVYLNLLGMVLLTLVAVWLAPLVFG